jgi:hypothetical protein
MFLDLNPRSVGQYVIYAKVTGSYGEHMYTRVGRRYTNLDHAVTAALKLAAKGTHDVTLRDESRKPFPVVYIDTMVAYRAKMQADAAAARKIAAAKRKAARLVAAEQADIDRIIRNVLRRCK